MLTEAIQKDNCAQVGVWISLSGTDQPTINYWSCDQQELIVWLVTKPQIWHGVMSLSNSLAALLILIIDMQRENFPLHFLGTLWGYMQILN